METDMGAWELASILVGGVATLAIYSFFYKENIFYRFFEHLYIGIAAGFFPVYGFRNFLWPKVIEPLLALNIERYPDGTSSGDYEYWILLYILPMLFGLLYYTIYFKRFSWMVKLVIGFSLGASAGLAFKGFFAEMMPQLVSSLKPLLVFNEGSAPSYATLSIYQSFCNTFFVLTLLAVMYYFFFTFKATAKGGAGITVAGRWLMMICFGSFFGSTVMARLALLVERVQFLLGDWWQAVTVVFIGGGS